MKKLLLILPLFITLSCSKPVISNLGSNSKIQNISELPKWVIDPEVQNGVAAVGISSPSVGGIKFQIPQAEIDAKANIASAVNSEISRITKDALREAKVGEVNDVSPRLLPWVRVELGAAHVWTNNVSVAGIGFN